MEEANGSAKNDAAPLVGSPVYRAVLNRLAYDEGHWDISYNLGKKFWGNGYMTEAMSAVIKYAVEVMKIKEISTAYAAENQASGNVFQKSGFANSNYAI